MNESHTYPSVTIKKIKFKNHEYSFNFNEDDIVLFVGANNVGKSRTLKDIREQMIDLNVKKVLIDDIEFAEHLFTYENMMDFLENNLSKDEYGNYCFCVNDYMTHNYSPSTITQDIFNSLNRFTDYYKLFYTFLSTDKQCFIATHNIDFIRGVLENGSSRVKIIKIDRNGSENKYNCLDNESVRKISNDKNLKYSNILNGLFYKHVILCEDESDCKFYSAILEVVDTETYQNTLFCAVGGKGQFSKIVPLLNSLHINWYIIADLDLLNSTETVKYLLDSIGENKYKEIEDEHRDFLRLFQEGTNSEIKKQKVIKNEIEKIFKTAKDDEFISKETASKISSLLKGINSYHLLKTGGISNIPSGECVRCYEKVRDYLNENHIFLLECGEIEGLVKTIGGHGSHWVEKVFESYPDMNDQVYNQAKNFMRFVIDKLNR